MKIKHYAKDWPENLKIPFTKKELRFFTFLELNKDFEKQIGEIRKKYSIPRNGFSYLREHEIGLGIPKYLEDYRWNQYLEDEAVIEDKFGFAGTWILSLTYFIKYNYMPKMAEEILPGAGIFDGEFTFQSLKKDYPALRKRKLFISLGQRMSKTQLKNLIDRRWDQINKLMQSLPVWNPGKNENVELYKEIVLLKKEKLSWNEIISALMNKYPEDERVLDEPFLRTLYSRYTKKLP